MGKQTVVVIGAGPAGMMAAAMSSSRGNHTILIEKNQLKGQVLLGKKLLITGNGRCNITNKADNKKLLANVPTNGQFLTSAFRAFTPKNTIDLLYRYGVKTKVEDNGRVLPQSDRSKDVVAALRKYVEDNGVEIRIGQVESVRNSNNGRFLLEYKLNDKKILLEASKVIIATGGKSYPQTGSTGDGYRFAKELGHHITPLKASLVPIETKEKWVKELQGVSFRSVKVSVVETDVIKQQGIDRIPDRIIFTGTGDVLFTHYGVTGPVIYSASAHISEEATSSYSIVIDIMPDQNPKELGQVLLNKFEINGKRQISTILQELLPKRIIPIILKLAGVSEDKLANQVTQVDRKNIVTSIKQLSVTVRKLRPLEEATVTSGGIDVNEVNPKTMESNIVTGLFIAGEVMDVDGYTGGFNIQSALSTGYLAGISC